MEHKNIVPNVDQCGLKELTSLKLIFCKHLECLIDSTREESAITAFSNLVNLDIGKMTCLKELCHGRSPISFLKKLETLSITDCRQLQSVFQMNGLLGKEESQTWTISNLRRLDLWSLPALESIWKEPTHHVRLQSLKKVKIHGCHKLKSIFSPCLAQSLFHLEELEIYECSNLEQVFAFDKEMVDLEAIPLSNLRSLKLHSLPALESIWKEPTDHVRLQSLKKVKIHGCHKLKSIFSPCLAQSLLHLEKLKISECENLEQVFTFNKEMVDLEAIPLSNLRSLKLRSLPALDSIWKDSTHHVSLQSLQNVIIDHCHKLESIFSPCLAQSLLHLEELVIYKCKNLEQVFAFDKEMSEPEDVGLHGVDHAIALPCLKDLRLLDLINLSCFCSETFLISSASLETLHVWNCPKLTNFKIKEQIQLKELDLSKLGNSFQLRVSPNCDQEYIAVGSHENVFHVHGRIEVLFLKDLSKERIIWKDVAQAVTLENLRILMVNDCKGLRCLFPLGSVCCLPKLEELRVKGNSKLEQVFEVEDEEEAKTKREIKFDQLKDLSLVELPSLVDFCPRGYHFVLSALNYLRVEGCPKMTTGFFIDSRKYVHAKTETLLLVEQDVTEGSATAQNVVHTKTIDWFRGHWGELPPYKEEL